jgi:hypothetical protein
MYWPGPDASPKQYGAVEVEMDGEPVVHPRLIERRFTLRYEDEPDRSVTHLQVVQTPQPTRTDESTLQYVDWASANLGSFVEAWRRLTGCPDDAVPALGQFTTMWQRYAGRLNVNLHNALWQRYLDCVDGTVPNLSLFDTMWQRYRELRALSDGPVVIHCR